jgi:hypothetical protein
MSFKDHATYGEVSVIGMPDYIYLNHPVNPGNFIHDNLSFHLHTMALNKEEALHLIESIQAWLHLTRSET